MNSATCGFNSFEEIEKRIKNENNLDEKFWEVISKFEYLPNDFILKNSNKLCWYWISLFQSNISDDVIEKCKDKILWSHFVQMDLSENTFKKFAKNIDWKKRPPARMLITPLYKKSEAFVRYIINVVGVENVHWESISCNRNLSQEFVVEYINDIDLNSVNIDLDENIIENNITKIDFDTYYYLHKISEEFLIKHSDIVNWLGVITKKHSEFFGPTGPGNMFNFGMINEYEQQSTDFKFFIEKFGKFIYPLEHEWYMKNSKYYQDVHSVAYVVWKDK